MDAGTLLGLLASHEGGTDAATMTIDTDDTLYVSSPGWMLAFPRPLEVLPTDLFEWMVSLHSNTLIDFRAAVGSIDYVMEKFLPLRSRQYVDLVARPTFAARAATAPAMKEMLNVTLTEVLSHDTVDLSAIYNAGQARPLYRQRGSYNQEDRKLESRPGADRFRFKFNDKVVVVNGHHLKALNELDITLHCPVASVRAGPPAIALQDANGEAIGILEPLKDSGIVTDSSGRSLYGDAAEVCWTTEDAALELLASRDGHPVDDLPDDIWDLLRRTPTLYHSTRHAVGALRWLGWEDVAIGDAYLQARMRALLAHHEHALRLATYWRTELEDGRYTFRAENELRRAARTVERVQEYFPEAELGDLPAAIQLLRIKQDAV